MNLLCCCFSTTTNQGVPAGPPPAYTPSVDHQPSSQPTIQKTSGAASFSPPVLVQSPIATIEQDALKSPFNAYLSGDFPDCIHNEHKGYDAKSAFVDKLFIDLDKSNLNNVDKRIILTNLYNQLMGITKLPTTCPPNNKTIQDPSLSFKLWNAIDGIKTPYAPFKVEDINLGYVGMGNMFPFRLIPAMEGRSGMDYIGYVDENVLYNLELYAGDPNNSDIFALPDIKSIIKSTKENALFVSSNPKAFTEALARQHAEGLARIGATTTTV